MLPIVFESYVHRFFGGNPKAKSEFRKYLHRKYGVYKKGVRVDDHVEYRYLNISSKLTEVENVDSCRQHVDTTVDGNKPLKLL